MWRIFRWLDTHPPSIHKFTIMLAGLAAIALLGFAIGQAWHPVAGFLSGTAVLFALMRASMTYRFEKKEKPPSQRDLPIAQASEEEILRRVHRHAQKTFWGRQILAARHEPGVRGELARSIIKRWEEAEPPEGKKHEPRSE